MTLEEREARRQQKGYTYKQLSEMTGLPEETVICAFAREMGKPGEEVRRKLEKVLCTPDKTDLVREAKAAYGAEKRLYTLEDYYALPDERRVELIDGVIYDMAAPETWHQEIIGEIFYIIRNYIHEKKGECKVYIAPVDVQLDRDYKTMVQPDVIILCDVKKDIKRCIMGAPDFVLEVLSDSTRKKDMIIKLRKYREAGVREYWMIDKKKEKVIVYEFEKKDTPVIYGFDSQVPVGIYQGDLVIDFQEIQKALLQ